MTITLTAYDIGVMLGLTGLGFRSASDKKTHRREGECVLTVRREGYQRVEASGSFPVDPCGANLIQNTV